MFYNTKDKMSIQNATESALLRNIEKPITIKNVTEGTVTVENAHMDEMVKNGDEAMMVQNK